MRKAATSWHKNTLLTKKKKNPFEAGEKAFFKLDYFQKGQTEERRMHTLHRQF